MKKKLWVRYFKEINNRKPTVEEIHFAMQQGEIEMNFFDKFLHWIMKCLSSKKIRNIIVISSVLLVSAILLFPFFRSEYNKLMYSQNNAQYDTVIEEYKNAIKNKSDENDYKLILEQPSRQPSYAKIDSNGDNKDELYIAFKDSKEEYDIIAIYEVQFGSVKKLDVSSHELSSELISKAKWNLFDVKHLISMNLDELSDGNYQSVIGSWVSENKKGRITFDSNGMSTVNGKNIREKNKSLENELKIFNWDMTLTGGFHFQEISKGTLSGNLEHKDGSASMHAFQFIPRGIEFKNSDVKYDRIYDKNYDVMYYSETDQFIERTANTSKVDIRELVKGNYSSIAGKWSSKPNQYQRNLKIDKDGLVYFDENSSNGRRITSIDVTFSSIILNIEGKTKNTYEHISLIPAGHAKDSKTDSDKDRIDILDKADLFTDPNVLYRVDE